MLKANKGLILVVVLSLFIANLSFAQNEDLVRLDVDQILKYINAQKKAGCPIVERGRELQFKIHLDLDHAANELLENIMYVDYWNDALWFKAKYYENDPYKTAQFMFDFIDNVNNCNLEQVQSAVCSGLAILQDLLYPEVYKDDNFRLPLRYFVWEEAKTAGSLNSNLAPIR